MVTGLDDRLRLRDRARSVRERILEVVWRSGSGHVGAALSQADLLVALYFDVLRIDPERPAWPSRDRFVLSKGHGGLGLAVVLCERGFITRADLDAFGKSGHAIGMHLDHARVPGVEVSTGSLGHGLGVAVGLALGAKIQSASYRTVCLLSDGECYEGSTWEAAISGAALGLNNLVAVIDRNRMTMDGETEKEVPLEPLAEKWRAFGWRVLTCDGHDFAEICPVFHDALASREKPTVVIGETVKGKCVSFMEARAEWHYGALDSVMLARAIADVRGERKPADVRALTGRA